MPRRFYWFAAVLSIAPLLQAQKTATIEERTAGMRKIDGYFAPKNPIHFPAAKSKSRAIGLPIDLLPELDLAELGGDRDPEFKKF